MIEFSAPFAAAAAALKPLPVPLPPVTIAWARDLPALPAAVLELMRLVGDDGVDPAELAEKMSVDMALTAKTLRLANSAFYGLRREVKSVGDAVSMLGMRMVKGLVTAAALGSAIRPPPCEGFEFDAFWRQGVARAVSAQMIGFAVDADPQAAFTAGLLFSIGQIVLASQYPERYAEVLAVCAATGSPLAQIEVELLGVDHAKVGARVAEHWCFPPIISMTIAAADGPLVEGAAPTLGQIVSAADRLVAAASLGVDPGLAAAGPARAAWESFGVGAEFWSATAADAAAQTDAICAGLFG